MYTSSAVVFCLAALAGLGSSAPTSGVTITVTNSCSYDVQVNQLTNDQTSNGDGSVLASGSSTDIQVASNWGGRIWARKECTGSTDCNASAPASLAEFLLNGANGDDFYDISLVDGYNVGMSISPNGMSGSGQSCGTPTCSNLPACPTDAQVKDADGNVVGCESSCKDCDDSEYAAAVKAACPEAYSYSTDDSTSMYSCKATGYTVNLC
ncbi:secreted thaumatin family protein [Phycomyces blakesleeanus]|uniref:Secreted thaumatin family protein n=2 Tax=Phycomyces blakesleeanus TaxID=4837 RepID=A0A162V0X7_PHYB8|nr:secreted thaumatin family protein [Phycomyces blakesleeanus NRRL 1555(-)]OAD79263.1 secreted thaumatin family protein [Phycomyces blakesleeanus NRRL 1555(-)]|eukprot:XP_018297303.1 secreted thaumatin family protein [Phycomyces blakesleeanus NRRL 1555(-)]